MKIVTIVGARPQFVKAAAVSKVLCKRKEINEVILHTGQHFDHNMSKIFFDEMNIPQPKYNLNINSLSHGAMTGKMLEEIEKILQIEKPNYVLVYGDTNSTLAGALAAKKMHIKVIHIEAGLRSFNMEMPEEINRILTDRISDFLFCPTKEALKNLRNEGFNSFNSKKIIVGDVMEDAALFFEKSSPSIMELSDKYKLDLRNYFLCTIHRAENTNNQIRIKEIVEGLNQLAVSNKIVIPVHPRTENILRSFNISKEIILIEPVGYLEMISLIKNSNLVLTDSGGLQKEAYFFNKYCVTLRDQTEWVELVNNGFNFLVGANSSQIIRTVEELKEKEFVKHIDLYGGGKASERILKCLIDEI